MGLGSGESKNPPITEDYYRYSFSFLSFFFSSSFLNKKEEGKEKKILAKKNLQDRVRDGGVRTNIITFQQLFGYKKISGTIFFYCCAGRK